MIAYQNLANHDVWEVRDILRAAFDGDRFKVPTKVLINALDGSVDCPADFSGDWIAESIFNKICDPEMGYLIDSLLEYGFVVPLNVRNNSSDNIKMGNGHHRLIAALLCGIEEIPIVISVDCLDWKSSETDIIDNSRTKELYEEYAPFLEEIETVAIRVRSELPPN